jgi:cbb3-type cytochrome oxidase maturation protein
VGSDISKALRLIWFIFTFYSSNEQIRAILIAAGRSGFSGNFSRLAKIRAKFERRLMEDTTLALTLTLTISVLLGILGLIAFLWALRNGQFDDAERFTNAVLFDSEDELNAAKEREDRKKEALAAAKNQIKEK